MAEAYLKDEKKLLPCAVQLNGEYGVKNIFAGVPVIIGKNGVEKIEEINQRTRDGGAEIVKYLEKGSAFYAPAASGIQMAEAYLNNEKKLLPCAIQLNGEYGVNNVYAGVPVIIGNNGVEKIEQIDLNEKEKKEFMHSIDAVKTLWEAASKIDPDLSK